MEKQFLNPNFVPGTLENNLMVSKGYMKIVWNNLLNVPEERLSSNDEPKFYIGHIVSNPEFAKAISSGELDNFFSDFAWCYRDVFAGSPWDEYVECGNPNCKKTLGSDYFFGKLSENYNLRQIERMMAVSPEQVECPECGHKGMKFYHDFEGTKERIKTELSKDACATLFLTATGKIIGFSYAWFDKPADLWDYHLKSMFSPINPNLDVSTCYDLTKEEACKPVVFWNEWGVNKHHRNSPGSIWLVEKLLSHMSGTAEARGYGEPQILGSAIEGSNAMSIYNKIGVDILQRDESTGLLAIKSPVKKTHDIILDMATRVTRFANRARKKKVA